MFCILKDSCAAARDLISDHTGVGATLLIQKISLLISQRNQNLKSALVERRTDANV